MRPAVDKVWNDFVDFQDKEAFHALYISYFRYLSYIGHKRGIDADLTKDGINDLFLYLWENRHRLNTVTSHHNYIITAFFSKLHNRANISDEFPDADTCDKLFTEPSIESLYIEIQVKEEVSRILRNIVDQLPEKQRLMIHQKFYSGLSYKEISEANKVSINTVYNTIYNAVEKLKIQLERDNPDLLLLTLTTLIIFYLFFL